MSPWPFKCYSTIIWCMVENVGIYSAWYFIIWIYCAKRISTFTSEFLWSFYRKWWRKEHIFFCTHWITYYMSITRFLTYIFLYRIGKKYEFCNVGIYLYLYLSKNPIFDLCIVLGRYYTWFRKQSNIEYLMHFSKEFF